MKERIDATMDPAGGTAAGRGSGEPVDEGRAIIRELGQALVTRLFSASKTIRLYDIGNRAVQRSLSDAIDTITALHGREQRAALRLSGVFVLVNDHRIPVESQNFGPFEYIANEMRGHEIEAVEFDPAVTVDELGNFLKALYECTGEESVFNRIESQIKELSIASIRIARLIEHDPILTEVKHETDVRAESNRVYFRSVALMGDILRTVEEKHILQVRKAKRLTQQMVDIIQTDESLLVGLASIKNFDAYTFMHSVNVCILSMLVGDRMRLDKHDVARLGVAALFHDIGKTYIPSSIINSSGQLSPREWELMKYHTLFGVKELSRMKALREAADPMFVALQHHVHFNNNGYPQRPGGWKLRLFSRIVTVADYYDAMTAARSYQKEPITPDKALRFILEKSGDIFDPFIAKVFIQAMGLFPIGTIVELDGGETAVVVRQNADARYIHRPVVEIVGAEGTVDLTERSSGEYSYRRTIVRTIHDSEIQVDKRPLFMMPSAD